MTISYKDFLVYADGAIKIEDCEFSRRNSMSRSYYAVYHAALEYGDSVSVPPVSDFSGPTHRKLSKFFEDNMQADKPLRLKLRRLGYSLKQLHQGRCDADYEIDETISQLTARDHLARCESRLKEFEELLSSAAA
ncbi:hypothetical protein GCM10009504_26960 [Pseudomonas laurentiana]|uniref:HEPN domain-containing protein n=1 Tax=Pseudomonas laurentiana TaxID=2364649 RepID=A0A6I5RTT3_9PSED|nr:hypothetical protein [Pseudomonas laurentiana]NES11080.1 hypothetical protein [Pseudomonas laurentiana]GGU68422.1 hypothetical protein GCM10009504_26960 [Pseudomonas laurentiana]